MLRRRVQGSGFRAPSPLGLWLRGGYTLYGLMGLSVTVKRLPALMSWFQGLHRTPRKKLHGIAIERKDICIHIYICTYIYIHIHISCVYVHILWPHIT